MRAGERRRGRRNASGGGRQEGVDYSGTNNQEQGVDEADFVKTDGYHIYTLNGNRLHIMGVPEFGELTAGERDEDRGLPAADAARQRRRTASSCSRTSIRTRCPRAIRCAQLVGYAGRATSAGTGASSSCRRSRSSTSRTRPRRSSCARCSTKAGTRPRARSTRASASSATR